MCIRDSDRCHVRKARSRGFKYCIQEISGMTFDTENVLPAGYKSESDSANTREEWDYIASTHTIFNQLHARHKLRARRTTSCLHVYSMVLLNKTQTRTAANYQFQLCVQQPPNTLRFEPATFASPMGDKKRNDSNSPGFLHLLIYITQQLTDDAAT